MINDSLIMKVINMIVSISKGYQLTIPAIIRNELDLGIGSYVDIKKENNKLIIEPIKEDLNKLFKKSLVL